MKEQNTYYTEAEKWLFFGLLIEEKNSIISTLRRLEEIASNPDHESYEAGKGIIDRLNKSEQKPKQRPLYDLRRISYNQYLEMILEARGVGSLIEIIESGEDMNKLKAASLLHNITKGKPATKVEITGQITHTEVTEAAKKALPKNARNAQWVNPEKKIVEAIIEDQEDELDLSPD